ncbi:MAG: hypothetical protein ACKOX3_06045 [Bacteroidota bacterium]
MKLKLSILLLLISSLFVYLSWGPCNEAFLGQIEIDVFKILLSDPIAVSHPFTMIPLAGQLLLLITIFQSTPNKFLIKLGVYSLLFLVGFVFIIGLISLKWKILLSTIPFLVLSIYTLRIRSKKFTN